MERETNQMKPNYRKIFTDMISHYGLLVSHQAKREMENVLSKEEFSSLDVLKINDLLFSCQVRLSQNQKLHKFDYQSKRYILDYQRNSDLSNVSTASIFKISRNTLAKWKRELG